MATIVAALAVPAAAVVTPTDKFYLKLTGTTAAKDPALAGTVIKDEVVPFVIDKGGSARGTVQIRTVRRASGQLSFYWRIMVAPDSTDGISIIHAGGFPNHAYEADWRPDGVGTVAPGAIGGSMTTATKEFDLYFQFYQRVEPGQSSRFFYIKTDATKSGPGYIVLGATEGGMVNIKSDAPVF